MKRNLLLSLSFLFILTGCATRPFSHGDREHKVLAVMWMQNAAEYRALCHQAYNLASDRLREIVRSKKSSAKPLAVVLDLDETVLDNIPYEASNILSDAPYSPESWDAWVARQDARALPGMVRFSELAKELGVELFYISNRRIKTLEDTYQNMLKEKIVVKRENIFLRTTTASKLDRRATILKDYEIALLIGDNLIDFHESFENLSGLERSTFVDSYSREFGRRLIVLPNPVYGDWLDVIYGNEENEGAKARMRQEKLYPIP